MKYCPEALAMQDWEILAKIHNGGPQGPTKIKTAYYWSKVSRLLQQSSISESVPKISVEHMKKRFPANISLQTKLKTPSTVKVSSISEKQKAWLPITSKRSNPARRVLVDIDGNMPFSVSASKRLKGAHTYQEDLQSARTFNKKQCKKFHANNELEQLTRQSRVHPHQVKTAIVNDLEKQPPLVKPQCGILKNKGPPLTSGCRTVNTCKVPQQQTAYEVSNTALETGNMCSYIYKPPVFGIETDFGRDLIQSTSLIEYVRCLSMREESKAATIIQKNWRMHSARFTYLRMKQAVLLIQLVWRKCREASKNKAIDLVTVFKPHGIDSNNAMSTCGMASNENLPDAKTVCLDHWETHTNYQKCQKDISLSETGETKSSAVELLYKDDLSPSKEEELLTKLASLLPLPSRSTVGKDIQIACHVSFEEKNASPDFLFPCDPTKKYFATPDFKANWEGKKSKRKNYLDVIDNKEPVDQQTILPSCLFIHSKEISLDHLVDTNKNLDADFNSPAEMPVETLDSSLSHAMEEQLLSELAELLDIPCQTEVRHPHVGHSYVCNLKRICNDANSQLLSDNSLMNDEDENCMMESLNSNEHIETNLGQVNKNISKDAAQQGGLQGKKIEEVILDKVCVTPGLLTVAPDQSSEEIFQNLRLLCPTEEPKTPDTRSPLEKGKNLVLSLSEWQDQLEHRKASKQETQKYSRSEIVSNPLVIQSLRYPSIFPKGSLTAEEEIINKYLSGVTHSVSEATGCFIAPECKSVPLSKEEDRKRHVSHQDILCLARISDAATELASNDRDNCQEIISSQWGKADCLLETFDASDSIVYARALFLCEDCDTELMVKVSSSSSKFPDSCYRFDWNHSSLSCVHYSFPSLEELCRVWQEQNIDLLTRSLKYRKLVSHESNSNAEVCPSYRTCESENESTSTIAGEIKDLENLCKSFERQQKAKEVIKHQRDMIYTNIGAYAKKSERYHLYSKWGIRRLTTGRLKKIVYDLLWIDPKRFLESADLVTQYI
ncbi:hypothetical protein O6H91_03G077100 [Diphasiastrum complanatum]|nr:hypothetical protein O6H91_03G077100 [Diphasiastrum complanatum]